MPKLFLVVDDSEAERELMAHTLRSAFSDAEVRTSGHPADVPRLCEAQRFDCVLLDYNMPELDGLALARRLRATDPYLPIILATNVGDEMLVAEALRSGASDYIPKPRVTLESIERIVNRCIHTCAQARLIDDQRAELENFAFALAHDFKQPIRQIITFSGLVSEGMLSGQTSEMQQHLTFLSDAASRLARLVDVMSQYTLLNQPPELEDIDLGRVIGSVRASLSALLEERSGELVSTVDLPVIRGNETLLIQILENLVINGLTYNRSAVPRVEVAARPSGEDWIVEVRDNGIGVDAEYLAEIFNPLVRLHTSAEYAGSGLGLTLARKAVLAQAGAIWCASDLGEGSVFHLRLPAARSVSSCLVPDFDGLGRP
ncbi:MAG: Phytochrome, two-component sensor histidine kinase [Caulobacter sp.]|nr:Phytochrome, two-component sensor histidine kinase [Caulobacter sp.]